MSCPAGKIRKSAFEAKRGDTRYYTKSTCIKDRGLPGRGPRLGVELKRGDLVQYGYHYSDADETKRRRALRKALKSDDVEARRNKALSIRRKLIYMATLNKNTHPVYARRLRADAAFLKEKFGK